MVIDVENVLQHLELDYEVHGHEALGLCPQHKERTGKEDHSPSWWVNLHTGQHICFSCGYKGSVLALICAVKDFHITSWGDIKEPDYEAAKLWLASLEEVSADVLAERLASIPGHLEQSPKPVPMSEARLVLFDPPPTSALDTRAITAASAAHYGILWDTQKERWILPFRDPDTHALMGWQEKGTLDRSFMNRPPGLAKSTTLFGAPQIQRDVVYVVESPLDCARLHSAGFPGAVAICGSLMSETQFKLIRYAERVVFAFDNPNMDSSGKKASDAVLSLVRKYGTNALFFNYGNSGKKDPGDMTDAEIAWGIDNAISALYGERAYVYGHSQGVPN